MDEINRVIRALDITIVVISLVAFAWHIYVMLTSNDPALRLLNYLIGIWLVHKLTRTYTK